MQSTRITRAARVRVPAIATSLILAAAIQVFAATEIKQPTAVRIQDPADVFLEGELDQLVTPTSCCEGGTCCSSSNRCNSGSCGSCCCKPVCCPKKVTEEVKQHCWKVKPEWICIPGFRFECNWGKSQCSERGGCCDCGDSCCSSANRCCDADTPTCGRVRCVNVLEKHEYTCEECGWEWEVKCVRTGQGCCHSQGNSCPNCGKSGGCASVEAAARAEVQLASQTRAAITDKPQAKKPSLASRLMGLLK